MNENNSMKKFNRDFLRSLILDQEKAFGQKDRGIEREELKELKKMVSCPQAVVISGLRRAGKSTLLAQLADCLGKNKIYYINFEDERFVGFSASDFNLLYEVLIELYGERKIFILDEIQNVKNWERFVRRFLDLGFKFFLTGSNASLLSAELGTKLTGRYLPIELFPFSLSEFLTFNQSKQPNLKRLTAVERGNLQRALNKYLVFGGIPDALKYPRLAIHQTLYDDILYRDVASRYQISELQALKELTFYLLSNVSTLISFNKLKNWLKLGSVNTVKNYIEYLKTAWLFFTVNTYAPSVRKQEIAPKKVYGIDTGLVKSVAFSFSENRGKLLENLVFLTLRRKSKEIYYYKTKHDHEVDFYLPYSRQLVQVVQNLANLEVFKREISGLQEAMNELRINSGLILTEDQKGLKILGKLKIYIQPIYEWILS